MWDLHLKASIACLLPSIPITTVRSLSAISLDVCTECREGAQTAEETLVYSKLTTLLYNTALFKYCTMHGLFDTIRIYIHHTYTYMHTNTVSPASAFILIRRAKKHFSRVFSSPFLLLFFISRPSKRKSYTCIDSIEISGVIFIWR